MSGYTLMKSEISKTKAMLINAKTDCDALQLIGNKKVEFVKLT